MFTHKLESAHGLQFKIKTDVVLNVAGSHVYFKSGTISKTVQDRDVVTTSVSKTDTCFSFDFFCFSHCASTDQQFTSFRLCQSNVYSIRVTVLEQLAPVKADVASSVQSPLCGQSRLYLSLSVMSILSVFALQLTPTVKLNADPVPALQSRQ